MKRKNAYGILFGGAALAILLSMIFIWDSAKAPASSVVVTIGETEFSALIAGSESSRARGLSGREKLEERTGLLFIFPRKGAYGFWMKGMKFPIDIVWINEGRVVGVEKNAEPEEGIADSNLRIYYPPEEIDMVFEVRAGESEKNGIEIGDKVSIKMFD